MQNSKWATCAALLPAFAFLVACTGGPVSVPSVAPPGAQDLPSAGATPSASPTKRAAVENDLRVNPLKRTFKSAGLTFNVDYSTSVPVERWTADGPQSIRITVAVVSNGSRSRKIYLTRASVRFLVRNESGELPGPEPVVDTANIAPGYLVTSPYTYEQSFAIPALDNSADSVDLAFKFEVVSLVNRKSADYTKQTATNTVRVPLRF